MADYAHTETDKRIEAIEKRLQAEYRQAYRETKAKLDKYLAEFSRKDEAKRELVEKGKLSQDDYTQWRKNQILTGKRWVAMVETLAKDINRTNQIAAGIISGDLKGTFALNANFTAYSIENGFRTDYGFTLYNEDTVNRLIAEDPELLPTPSVDIPKDIRWNKQKISSNITQAVLQGKSIPDIAKGMQTVVGMNKAAATRNARTAMTGAQNAGRQASYDRAKAMGIKVKKEWIATLDGRTRHSHGMADGQQVELDGKFTVGSSKMLYPGDFKNGSPEELYNCRCTMGTVEPPAILRGEDPRRAFDEWIAEKGGKEYKKYQGKKAQVQKAMEEKQVEEPQATAFTPAKTIEEAEEYGKRFVAKKTWSGNGEISYKGLSVENANKMNETLTDLFATYDMPLFENIKPMNFRQNIWKGSENAPFAYRSSFNGELYFNPKIAKSAKAFDDYFKKGEEAFEICKKNIDRFSGSQRKMVERYVNAGRQLVADDAKDKFVASIQHEFGHHIQNQALWKNKYAVERMNERIDEFGAKLSGYASSSKGEYVAESFCAFMNGETERIDPFMKQYFEGLKKQ